MLHRIDSTVLVGEITAVTLTFVGIVYSDRDKYPYVHAYLDFMIGEIPSLLQILTFAGFLAVLFRHNQSGSTLAITSVVVALNNLYLNNKQHKYIYALGQPDKTKNIYAVKFMLFNIVFTTLLFVLFISTARFLVNT